MKVLKIAFRHLLKHYNGGAERNLRGDPWRCGEHSNVHVRQPKAGRTGIPPADRERRGPGAAEGGGFARLQRS